MKKFLPVLLVIIIYSCSGKAPEIVKNDWMLNYVYDLSAESKQEELSCFLMVSDPDGNEDLNAVYIINDDKELYWEVTEELWIDKSSGKNRWLGFNRFQPPGEIFASGSYRIQVVDKGGLVTESRIYIPENRLKLENIQFPEITNRRDSIKIEGSYPKYLIWFYDAEGELVHSHYTRKGTYTLNQLMDNRTNIIPDHFWVFVFIESRYTGIKVGPFPVIR